MIAREAIAAIARIESPRLIATLARMLRDVALAEEVAQDALVLALERWPADGVPDKPGAWLQEVARRRAIDLLRRDSLRARKLAELEREPPHRADDEPDELLGLLFLSCHPALAPEARTALTLRLAGGLTSDEIARAYLVPRATLQQRLVRAKKILAAAEVAFEPPRGEALRAQLPGVLEVICLIFNEGYAATSGEEWTRPQLCGDALRLARMLVQLVPGEAEAHGLCALLELQASRLLARRGPDGAPVLLADQDRRRWDALLIRRGLAALAQAERLSTRGQAEPRAGSGPYALQAAIAACHARARSYAETDWPRIAALYAQLFAVQPSPVVQLNRAVAVSMAEGPAQALALLEPLSDPLAEYHLYFAVRADLLARLGRGDEARRDLLHAATLTQNERERTLLLERAAAL